MDVSSPVRWTQDQGEFLVREFRASGQSLSLFCRERGIVRSRLDYWVRRSEASVGDGVAGFVAVRPLSNNDGLDITLDRVVVRVQRGFDASLLRSVIEALS